MILRKKELIDCMANLGFTYTLNVNERATEANLKTFITNTFGQETNPKLKAPIKLDFGANLSQALAEAQETITKGMGGKLTVPVGITLGDIDSDMINKVQAELNRYTNKLSLTIGTQIATPASADISQSDDKIEQKKLEVLKSQTNELLKQKQFVDSMAKTKSQSTSNANKPEKEAVDILQKRIALENKALQQAHQQKSLSTNIRALTREQSKEWEILGRHLNVTGNSYKEVSLQSKELRQSMKALELDGLSNRVKKNDSMWAGLSKTLTSLPMQYLGLHTAMNKVSELLNNSVDHIFNLDEAYTQIAITMDMTQQEYRKWLDIAKSTADVNGTTTQSLIEMVKVYATAGEDISSVQEKLAGTAMIQNVTEWDAEKTTSAVNSIINQYKLLDKEINGATGNVANAIEYMGDSLVAISNSLSVDNVAGIQEMVSAIDTAGGVINQAGGSLEWFMAVSASAKETINATGEETGNAWKMIQARVLQNKQAIEEMGESVEDFEIDASRAEKALNSVGVTIRGQGGDLRTIEDIMGDLAGKWDTLSDSTKQYLGYAVAGANRLNFFSTAMNNYNHILELQNIGLNSNGELTEASDLKAQSLEGTLNRVKNTMGELYQTVLSQDTLKTVLNDVDSILQGAVQFTQFMEGKWVTTLGIATGAILGFKVATSGLNFIEYMQYLGMTALEHIGLTGAVSASTIAVTAFKMAVGGLAVGGLVWVLSNLPAIVGWFQNLGGSVDKAKDSISNLQKATNDYKDSISNLEEANADIDTWFKLQKEIKNSSLSVDEFNTKNAQSADIMSSLAQQYPDIASILENENIQLDIKLIKIEQITEALEKEYQMNMLNSLASEKDMNALVKSIDDQVAMYEQYAQARQAFMEDGSQPIAVIGNSEFDMSDDATVQYFENIRKNIALSMADIEIFNNTVKELQDNGLALDVNLIDVSQMELASEFLQETREAVMETNNLKQETINLNREIALTEEEIAEKTKNANQSYVETLTAMKDAKSLLNSINEEGMNLDNMASVMSMFEDFSGSISDKNAVVDYINEQLLQMEQSALTSYNNMIAYDNEYWDSKLKNSQEWANYQKEIFDGVTQLNANALSQELQDFAEANNLKLELRNIDLSNAQNMAQAQAMLEGGLIRQLMNYWGTLINEKGDFRSTDLNNINEFLNQQGVSEAQTVNELAQMWAQFYNAKAKAIQQELSQIEKSMADSGIDINTLEGYEEMQTSKHGATASVQRLQGQMGSLNNMNDSFTNFFESVNAQFTGIATGLDQAKADINSLSTPDAKKSGSGSSSTAKEKEVADLEDIRDRYYEIANALKDVDNALSLNSTRQEYKTGVELANLYKEQISLLQDKSKLLDEHRNQLSKESDELRNRLSAQGFVFDDLGNIMNYQAQFAYLIDKANHQTGESKENAKKSVEELMDAVNRYTTLIKDEIPNATNEWESMASAVKKVEKEIAQTVTDTQKEVQSAIEHALQKRYDTLKKALEKEKDLYNQQYEEEEYEDNLKAEQSKLDSIKQQMADLERDSSDLGRAKLAQLRLEYEAQQKAIDDMIKEWQKEQTNNRFDEEQDRLDEELEEQLKPENIVDMVNQAITSGFVTIGDEVTSLGSIMDTFLNETGDGLYALGDTIRTEFIEQLETAKSLMADLGITSTSAKSRSGVSTASTFADSSSDTLARNGISVDSLRAIQSQGVSVVFDAPLLQIDGNVDADLMPEIQSLIKRSQNETIAKIEKSLKTR